MAEHLISELNKLLSNLFHEQKALRQDLKLIAKDIQDLKASAARSRMFTESPFDVLTDYKVAIDSWDHIQPRGAANDNTRCPWFVSSIESVFVDRTINYLDLGCAGGGLVFDFLLQGHRAIGIEGSDYLKRTKGGHWLIIPDNLFTADITKPFEIRKRGASTATFEVITAMEVMEHIPEDAIPKLMSNIHKHLADDGVFCCSIATFPDFDPETGAVWHVTLKEKSWWINQFEEGGFRVDTTGMINPRHFPRGTGNLLAGYGADNDFIKDPNLGFHLVLRKNNGVLSR